MNFGSIRNNFQITHLGVSQLGPQLVLLLLIGELGVDAVNLVTELVDGSLELVLLLVGLGNELVLHVHGVLPLGPSLLGGLVNATSARGNGQVTLADLLLDLAGLLGLLLGVHSITVLLLALLGDGLLNLDILNVVTRLNVQDTVQVQASLELADHEVVVGVSLDTLHGEAADPGVDLAGQLLGLGVASLEVEGLLAVESKDLGRGHDVAAAKDSKAGVLVGNVGGLLPGEVDGVVDDVVNGKVTDTEHWGESGAAEGGTTGNSLILVKREGQGLAEELADGLLDGGNTSAATDHLNVVDVLDRELSLCESLLQRDGKAVQERADHLLKLLPLDHGADISVLHEGLNAEGGLRVSRQDLLELLGGSQGTGPGLRVGADIDLELLLELLGEALGQSLVEVTAAEVTVTGRGLDVQLTLAELDNGGSVVAVTDVDENDSAGLLIGAGQVELGDTITKGGSGGVVDETEDIETSDLTGVDHSAALNIAEPGGNADSDIGDGKLELLGGDVFDLGQVHGNQLSRRELLLLAEVVDLNTSQSVDIADVAGVELLLDLNIGVAEGTADQALERADSVLQVGSLLCLGSLADGSAAGIESDQGTVK